MLIANHLVRSWKDGEAIEFKKGEQVTGLSAHDEQELVKCGAVTDTAIEAVLERRQERAESHAAEQFEREREAVMAARASVAPAKPAAGDASTQTPPPQVPPDTQGQAEGTNTKTAKAGKSTKEEA